LQKWPVNTGKEREKAGYPAFSLPTAKVSAGYCAGLFKIVG
jgi:hypothetical protein